MSLTNTRRKRNYRSITINKIMRRENLWGNSVRWYIATILFHYHTSKYNNGTEISKKLSRYIWGWIKNRKIMDIKILYKPEPQQRSPHLPRLWGTQTLLLKRQKKNANVMTTSLTILDLPNTIKSLLQSSCATNQSFCTGQATSTVCSCKNFIVT